MHILYIEDNAQDVDLTRRALAKAGDEFIVDTVSTLKEALRRVKKEAFDLLLCDMRLPDGTALDLIGTLGGSKSHPAMVIITGSGDEETAVAVLKAGADDYLVKRRDYLEGLPTVLIKAFQQHWVETRLHEEPLSVLYGEHNLADIDLTIRHLARVAPHIHLDVVKTPEDIFKKLFPNGKPAPYQVLLIDYRMPGKNGLEILKELKQVHASDLPVVIITGHGDEDMAVQVFRFGAADYIVKHTGYLFALPSVLENVYSNAQLRRERKELQETQRRLATLMGDLPGLAYRCKNDPDWTMEFVSDGCYLLTGYQPADLVGNSRLPYGQIIRPEDRQMVWDTIQAELKKRQRFQLNYRIITAGGEEKWVWEQGQGVYDSNGALLALEGFITDVTERNKAVEALQESEDRYRGIFENSPISLWEEDYSSVRRYIGDLRKKGVKSFRNYFRSHPEAVIECTRLIKTLDVNQATLKMFAAKNKTEIVKNVDAILGDLNENMQEQLVNIAEGKTNFEWQGVNYTITGEPRVVSLRWSAAPGYEDSLSKVNLSMIDVTERKQAEEALRKSERRYRSLFEDSSISLWEEDFSEVKQFIERLRRRGIKDFRAYFGSHLKTAARCMRMIRVVEVNKATLKLFEVKNKDEIVENWDALIGISESRMVEELVGIAEGRTDFEWQEINHTLGGEKRVVNLRWSIAPGYEDSLSKVILSVVDVTERKQAEEKLRESEQKLRRVIEESTDGILLTDEEGRIIEWNTGQEHISGLKREKVLGRSLWDVRFDVAFPDQKIDAAKQAMRSNMEQILKSGQAPGIGRVTEDELVRVTDGSHVFIESVLFPIKTEKGFMVCTITRDVTERKGVIERLEMQSTALGAAANGIFIVNAGGEIVWANPAFSKLTGYTYQEALNTGITILLTDIKVPSFYEGLWKAVQDGKVWGGELASQRKDGSIFNVELTITPVLGERNKPINYIGIMNDITESVGRRRELESTAHVSETLRLAHTREEMFPIIIDQMMTLLRADAAAIVLKDILNSEQIIEVASGELASVSGTRMTLGAGVVGDVIVEGKPRVSSIEAESEIAYRDLFKKSKVGAWYPLLVQEEVLGAIFLARSIPFEDTELRLIESVTNMAANAFQRTRLFEQMQERLQQMEVQRDIDQAILTSFDLRMTLNILLRHLITQLDVAVANVLLLDTATNELEAVAGQGYSNPPRNRLHVKVGEGMAGRVILEGKPVFVANIQDIRDRFKFKPLDFDQLASYYALPLIAKGQPKGVLELMTRKPLKPSPEWKQFLETLARQAAIAIENAQMFETLQRSNTELLVAYDATIEGWVRALDMRDKETEGHTLRVADIMLDLAREMHMSEADLVHVRRGALLHDIGKMGVPDSILLKPGPLTDEEWAIMRRHPQFAYEMLSPISYLRPAIDIPYCHHEKWDGSGYPRGLRGEEIPLAARIFAIVDVWDALLSDRPYRSAWSKKETLDYIHSQSGKHFDPSVVEAFTIWVERHVKQS
jgi:PAS domain S-box-containing protein/putative nucleotidyltransferase with HDIG domain